VSLPNTATSGEHRILVIQGEFVVTDDPSAVLVTLLGSCVAACMRDPVAGVGGLNHFLLPGNDERSDQMRHGVHAMELLVNGLLARGARKDRLEAKIFGGAKMVTGLTDVGRQNALFAERFLQREGIPIIGSSLGGEQARRIQFWPVSGRVRQLFVEKQANTVFEAEVRRPPKPVVPASDGAVELF
jgi:chemotaxis protein CheD